MKKPIAVGSKSHRFMVVVWVTTTSLLLVLFSSFGLSVASGTSPMGLADSPPEHTALYPSTRYGGLYWSLQQVRHTPAAVRPCAFGGQSQSCESVLVLEFVVTNVTQQAAAVSIKDLGLLLPEGLSQTANRFDCSSSSSVVEVGPIKDLTVKCPQPSSDFLIKSGESRLLSVLFTPDIGQLPDFSEISFQILEAHRPTALPAHIPLGGSSVEIVYPRVGAILGSGQPQKIVDPTERSRSLTIEPISAHIDVNYNAYRVVGDKRLLLLDVVVGGSEGSALESFLDTAFWSLRVGDERVSPDLVESISSGEGRLILQFSVHPDSKEFELLVGDQSVEESAASFPLLFEEYS